MTAEIIDISIPDKSVEYIIKKQPGLKYRYLNRTMIVMTVRFSLDGKRYRSKLRLNPLISNPNDNHISDGSRAFGRHLRDIHNCYYDSDAKQRAEFEVGRKIDITVDKKNKRRIMLDKKISKGRKRANIFLVLGIIAYLSVLAFILYVASAEGNDKDRFHSKTIYIPSESDESSSIPDEYKKGIELWDERNRQQNYHER